MARSRSVFGPYEKLGVPLLSTALVGSVAAPPDGSNVTSGANDTAALAAPAKMVGPGHASFVQDPATRQWFAVYHASPGNNCNRHAFVDRLRFGDDGWPRIDFVQ